MDDTTDAFLTRLDEFASGLTPVEQAMLHALLSDDDAAGFGFDQDWPGARSVLSPLKLGTISTVVNETGPISSGDQGSGRRDGGRGYSDPISGTDLGSGRVDF